MPTITLENGYKCSNCGTLTNDNDTRHFVQRDLRRDLRNDREHCMVEGRRIKTTFLFFPPTKQTEI